MRPNPSFNRTAQMLRIPVPSALRIPVPSALRAPAAGYVERYTHDLAP